MVCMYHSFLIHSSPDGHLGCFHVLAIINLLYGPVLTSTHDYWKNHRFDYMDLCQQSLCFLICCICFSWASLVTPVIKNLPTNSRDISVSGSIPGEIPPEDLPDPASRGDALEEGMATCSSILAWRISWTEESGRLHSMWLQRVRNNWSNLSHRFVIAFLPRSKCLLISWLQSPSSVILELKKIESATVSTVSPSICHEVMGPDTKIWVFWVSSFKPAFSLSSFTFIKRHDIQNGKWIHSFFKIVYFFFYVSYASTMCCPGLLGCHQGRQWTNSLPPRVLHSSWRSRKEMDRHIFQVSMYLKEK